MLLFTTYQKRKSVLLPCGLGRVSPASGSSLIALSSSFYIIIIILIIQLTSTASASPPLDYLVYSSQQASATQLSDTTDANNDKVKNGYQGKLLRPTLESIYSPHWQIDKVSRDNSSSNKSANILKRVFSLINNSSHTHDNHMIDLETSHYAWHLMEKQALFYIEKRINSTKPLINELLHESNVSSSCQLAINGWLDRMLKLEHWATIMWNAWGSFPPAGLFEGSFTDLGSYTGCLGVGANDIIGEAQYCALDFQPLVPTRPRFHTIFKKALDIKNIPTKFGSLAPETFLNGSSPWLTVNDDNHESKQATKLETGFVIEMAKKAQFFYYVRFRFGSCWPTKCSVEDIQRVSQVAGARVVLQSTKTYCISNSDKQKQWNLHQWVAVLILGSIAGLVLLASLLDAILDVMLYYEFEFLVKKFQQLFGDFVDICSLQRNSRRLFSNLVSVSMTTMTSTMSDGEQRQQQQQQPLGQLTCLHGLKFISMVWVIYGHTLLFADYQAFTHGLSILENGITNLLVFPTLNANFSVDTFFVISGLLAAYIIFSVSIKFNPILFTVARYIRLTPQLFIIILMFFLLPLLGDGPLYRQGTEVHANKCFKNFWLNLLYLQTYINNDELCMIPSWWLSIEMTFHMISLVVIYILIKRPKVGMLVNLFVIFVLTLVGAIIHYKNGFAIQYLPSIPQKYEVNTEQTRTFFHKPYPHAASYFIGLALGFVLARRRIKRLSRSQLYLGWFISCFGFVFSLWGSYNWNLGAPYTQLQATVYYNVCQVLWPISIAWVILTCSLGHGGRVNKLLSAKFFVPLGRVTYMTYLSHILVVYYYAFSVKHTIEPSSVNLLYICISNIFLSLVFGTVLSLVYEAPMMNLQRILVVKKYSKVETNVLSPVETNGVNNHQLIIDSNNDILNAKGDPYKSTLGNNIFKDSKG